MPRTTRPTRQVALCYIRQSQTRDEDDNNSPRRQRDNIQRVCEQNGWLPEWYEDVGGQRLKVRPNSNVLIDGNSRYYEMIRRMNRNPNGLFKPDLFIPVEIVERR